MSWNTPEVTVKKTATPARKAIVHGPHRYESMIARVASRVSVIGARLRLSHRGDGHPRILDLGTPAILGHAPRRTSRIDNVTTDAAEATTTVPAATSDAV